MAQARLILAAAIALGACGLRKGEVLGLRWSDVDLAAGRLRITQTLAVSSRGLVRGEPKTRAGRRVLPLPAAIVQLLRRAHAAQLEERLGAGSSWIESGLVITNARGGPFRDLFRQFKRVLRLAGLPDVRFHDLRHAVASHLASAGASARDIMDWLGHATPAMALHYTHIAEQQRQATGERFSSLFGPEQEAI